MILSREQISAIAHGDHPIACPLSDRSVADLLEALTLPPGGRVLDVGCGPGEWLKRLFVHFPEASGTGVDLSLPMIDLARHGDPAGNLDFVQCDAVDYLRQNGGSFSAILCNGSTHVFGGWQGMLEALDPAVTAGGEMILSDGFWQGDPSPDLCEMFAMPADDTQTVNGKIAAVEAAGYDVICSHVSSTDEWDVYEDSWCSAVERFARKEDSLAPAETARLLALTESRRAEYLHGYRGILGYLALVTRKQG